MLLEKGNMWDAFGKGIFMITTNPIQRNDGAVVMGRGIALAAKSRFPTLPYIFGEKLRALRPEIDNQNVGWIGDFNGTPIWWFMVKDHWKADAKLSIIEESCFRLMYGFSPMGRIDMNFPGIGNGRLKRADVLPLLEKLPDTVHVWEYM